LTSTSPATFFPATVSTNLLFFQKGTPTKEIWYWEHRLPEGQKSYSKTKAIQFEEFASLIKWWDKREESDVAWKVKVGDLKRGFDLDVKNPHRAEEENGASTSEIIAALQKSHGRVASMLIEIESLLSK
jgi:type I restriction enzyme M protein